MNWEDHRSKERGDGERNCTKLVEDIKNNHDIAGHIRSVFISIGVTR